MANLIVAGCSVSDYTDVSKVWGEYLAEKLNLKYIHLAKGCGSNYRIWRLLSSKIIAKEITAEDTVIIQYTTIERNEFWSSTCFDQPPAHLREQYNQGSILKFKYGSHTFGYNKTESKFLKLYERFINLEFEQEKFSNNHMMFQCLAKQYNIKNLYFVKAGSYTSDSISFISEYKNNFFRYDNIFNNKDHCLPNDTAHFSNEGHRLLANELYTEISK